MTIAVAFRSQTGRLVETALSRLARSVIMRTTTVGDSEMTRCQCVFARAVAAWTRRTRRHAGTQWLS
eukprot:888710-Rhodomonas_salina.1